MNRRTFLSLAVIACLLALVALISQRRGDVGSIAGDTAGELLMPELAGALERIDAVQINGAGGERLVSLEHSDGGWTVVEQDGYEAEVSRVNGLLIAMAEARIVEEKTSDPAFFDRLGVEPIDDPAATGLELAFLTDAGDSYSVILGDAYGSEQRYARPSAADQSVLIDRNPNVQRSAADWVRPEIMDIAALRIQRVDIRHADGERLLISKSSPEETNFAVDAIPEGRELQYASIANVTGSVLAGLNLEAVSSSPAEVDAETAAAEPVAVIEYRTFDGLVVTVTATADPDADADPWLSFRASLATEEPEAEAEADAESESESESETETEARDVAAEADAINARLGGWRYRIPDYQYSQLTRRMDDLLRDPPDTDE